MFCENTMGYHPTEMASFPSVIKSIPGFLFIYFCLPLGGSFEPILQLTGFLINDSSKIFV